MKLQDLHPNHLAESEALKALAGEDQEKPTVKSDEVPDTEEENLDNEEEDVNVGDVAKEEGFEKSSTSLYVFGKTRTVTVLTKNQTLDGLELTLQYVINPATGAWLLNACLAGQSQEDMVEFAKGEDPTSLVKSLRKKTKITAHQAVQFLNPPADSNLKNKDD